ncbi:MAG: LpxI family protein [Alphaproteobacteria bacterium]|nr:MAG: LpxI family protein [Alphaproteobacteria bacterium]
MPEQSSITANKETRRLGIIAGGGGLPQAVIDSCVANKKPFFILALQGFTDPALVEGHPHEWVRLGALGQAFAVLKSENVTDILMAGRLRRPSLQEIRPDARGMQFFAKYGTAVLGDDGILRAISKELESEGFAVIGAQEAAEDILMPRGLLTKKGPQKRHKQDIVHGWKIAALLGEADVGQAVVLQEGLVLGLEAIEGTDELMKRCTALRRAGLLPVLVKRCKPGQDLRADLPTIGLETVETAREAGFAGIAVEAGKAVFLDRAAAIAAADEIGMFIYGVTAEDIEDFQA